MPDQPLRLLAPTTVRIGRPTPRAGSWASSGPRQAPSARERLGYGKPTSLNYPTGPSFYSSERNLMPSQLWQLYRTTPDVRACVDSITRRIATWDWSVRPTVDPRERGRYDQIAERCAVAAKWLQQPNANGETWQELLTRTAIDLLVYDAGVLELNVESGTLLELVPWLGCEWFPLYNEKNVLQGYTQEQEEGVAYPAGGGGGLKVPPERLCYFSLFRNNREPLGVPLMDTLVNECITVLLASEHSMLALDADEIPPGLLVIGGVAGAAAERARADLQQMRGKDHRVRVISSPQPGGIKADWLELRHSVKDVQLLEVVDQMRRAIWRVFGVMPVELGVGDSTPRALAEVQVDVSSSHLIAPILELLQARINAQVMPLLMGDDAQHCTFAFDRAQPLTPDQKLSLARAQDVQVRRGIITVNEARATLGLLPVDGGDTPVMDTNEGPRPLTQVVLGAPPATAPADEAEQGTLELALAALRPALTAQRVRTANEGSPLCGEPAWSEQRVAERYAHIDFAPTKGVLTELGRGLQWHEEGHSGDGLRPATVAWARRMAGGAEISPEKARLMRAWLARHAVDKEGEGYNPGEPGYPSPGRVSWALWGGDPAVPWSGKLVGQLEADDDKAGIKREAPPPCTHDHATAGERLSCTLHRLHSRDAEWLPSSWPEVERFSGYRTIDLDALAEVVEDYGRAVTGLYQDASVEMQAMLLRAYGGDRVLSVTEAQRAQAQMLDRLDELSLSWSIRTRPFYQRAAQLAVRSASTITDRPVDVGWRAGADVYHGQAMAYLVQPSGLIGTLQAQVRRIISAATMPTRDRIDELSPDDGPGRTTSTLAVTMSAQAARIDNWSGRLVGLANAQLVSALNATVAVSANGSPVEWMAEWVNAGGRSCDTCIEQGAQPIRALSQIGIRPGEDTLCVGRCRCVLVFWTRTEVDGGQAVSLSALAPGGPDA